MTPRNKPIEDQNKRLLDIEIGDSIIWRGRIADDRSRFVIDPVAGCSKRFLFEKQDDGVYLATRIADEI